MIAVVLGPLVVGAVLAEYGVTDALFWAGFGWVAATAFWVWAIAPEQEEN